MALVGAAASACDDPGAARVDDALTGGTVTGADQRPEIGRFDNECHGTLIHPRWVLSTASCPWGSGPLYALGGAWSDVIDTPSVDGFELSITHDGVAFSWDACDGGPCEVERTITLHGETVRGANDLVLVRLANPVRASEAVPTSIATGYPNEFSTVTAWGSSSWLPGPPDGGGGVPSPRPMQWREHVYGTPSGAGTPDVGGPRTLGVRTSGGAVYALTSNDDVVAEPIPRRAEIMAIVNEWEAHGAQDISRNGWCTQSTGRVHWGDVDANGTPDAICHDVSSGALQVAENRNRVIRQQFSSASAFCAGTGRTLLTGDFNGDGRTDLLCRTSGGVIEIDYASSSSATRYRSSTTSIVSSAWCTHSTATLQVADVNGDRRSDLLCRDRVTGQMWIDLASTAATGQFAAATDLGYSTSWCTHSGARLYVGDFNGDHRSDLLCHTTTTGHLHLQLANAVAPYYDATTDAELASGRSTGIACTGTGQGTCSEGQQCESGACRERLCVGAGSRLSTADHSGDGLSDVLCEYPSGRTAGLRSYGGRPSAGGALLRTTADGRFGWLGRVRARRTDAASQPWSTGS
ncbi:putative secreted esterase [Sandaracinus amylolyticus]|uniref:Putative secreted esterase n=1 Tax=Sandaracinus amylolyticus TaxID=927083 RepID=A0A0F6W2L2_9BACT|nr:putative secreted esterase [Sandaracinus amylolyticus]